MASGAETDWGRAGVFEFCVELGLCATNASTPIDPPKAVSDLRNREDWVKSAIGEGSHSVPLLPPASLKHLPLHETASEADRVSRVDELVLSGHGRRARSALFERFDVLNALSRSFNLASSASTYLVVHAHLDHLV